MQTGTMINANISFNLSRAQYEKVRQLLEGGDDAAEETTPKKRASRKKPESTVDEDEEESFGKRPLKKADLASEDDDADSESDDEEDETDETEEDEDAEAGISFEEVKAAMNKYGEKFPDQMRAILAGFNLKGPKELKAHPAKWEPVYKKTMAKIKTMKKE